MIRQAIITSDGSPTLYVPELNEHYHSTRGAITESNHVFIENGLQFILRQPHQQPLQILEIGFGTGLNALLTWQACEAQDVKCRYATLEKYPLRTEEVLALNYPSPEQMKQLHSCAWNCDIPLSTDFTVCKITDDLLEYQPQQTFDLIFFDAFAPTVQPDLWSDGVFRKLYEHQSEDGVLVTYSSKGSVKQALRNAGYHVQRLPGAAGKRHMVRACKSKLTRCN